MASLYAQYLFERTNDLIMESPSGFATYRYLDAGATVYIVDIFIVPNMRQAGEASRMADEIVRMAKENGATKLLGSVVPSMKNSTASIKVLLGYGMKLESSGIDYVIFKKDI